MHPSSTETSAEKPAENQSARKPEWLKVRAPGGLRYIEIRQKLRDLKLFTVCEEARCPNIAECWMGGTATIMLLGDVCTRGCRFCGVKTGRPGGVVDEREPEKVAGLIAESGLGYVVLTSVNRDDLPDGGAAHFAATIRGIKSKNAAILCEALVPDFKGDLASVETLVRSGVDVYAHNIETVRRLTPKVRDRRATYDQSLGTLAAARGIFERLRASGERVKPMLTKSSIQVGHGETDEEVLECLRDLRAVRVDVVTFGQYLRPTKRHLEVQGFVTPEKFRQWEEVSREMGFAYAAAGPLVRSSYKAGEYYLANMLKQQG